MGKNLALTGLIGGGELNKRKGNKSKEDNK
jgi:hypothetical protein